VRITLNDLIFKKRFNVILCCLSDVREVKGGMGNEVVGTSLSANACYSYNKIPNGHSIPFCFTKSDKNISHGGKITRTQNVNNIILYSKLYHGWQMLYYAITPLLGGDQIWSVLRSRAFPLLNFLKL